MEGLDLCFRIGPSETTPRRSGFFQELHKGRARRSENVEMGYTNPKDQRRSVGSEAIARYGHWADILVGTRREGCVRDQIVTRNTTSTSNDPEKDGNGSWIVWAMGIQYVWRRNRASSYNMTADKVSGSRS
eukprot:sb/3475095/